MKPDPFYERKIALLECDPADSYLNESELHAIVKGRYRGDGRRIDRYVLHDPLEVDLG